MAQGSREDATGAARGSFPLDGSNVFERARLHLIIGAAAHDIYHAGLIQLPKKLSTRRSAGR